MEIGEAWDKAQRILMEERVHPTVRYKDRLFEMKKTSHERSRSDELLDLMERWGERRLNPSLDVSKDRESRPRYVHEVPGAYAFKSENFDLLTIVLGQLSADDRPNFIYALTQLLSAGNHFRKAGNEKAYPSYRGMVSETPLLAEFFVRNGYAKNFFEELANLQRPTIPLLILLLQLEDMIALNFTLLSDDDLKAIPKSLQPLLEESRRLIKAAQPGNQTGALSKAERDQAFLARQSFDSIVGIIEECRSARHYYLKGQLLNENPNLEIEGDKKKLTDSLGNLGFDPILIHTLRKAEELYKPTSDAFDLKSCIGFIRSFIERLHVDSATAIAATMQTTVFANWHKSTEFLRHSKTITEQQEKLARGLYAVLSDEGVHPVMAKREFCRLARNMVIEYGVMFLSVLSDKGFKIGHAYPIAQP